MPPQARPDQGPRSDLFVTQGGSITVFADRGVVMRHPIFLIVNAKLAEATKAPAQINAVHLQQCALRAGHPDLCSPDVHAESVVTNVQDIHAQLESVLKTMASTIDDFSPSGDASHRNLLLQASASDTDRPEMISAATAAGMGEMLKFRHAVRNNYASALRHDDVFENLRILQGRAPLFCRTSSGSSNISSPARRCQRTRTEPLVAWACAAHLDPAA